MKRLFLFLLLVLSVGAFSELKVLKNKKKSKHLRQSLSVSSNSHAVSVKKTGKKTKHLRQSSPVSSNSPHAVSVKKTGKKPSSFHRRPTAQEADPALKEKLVGEDYYQTVDSKVIQQEVNEHLVAIERLCDIEDSAGKIREWNRRSQALTQLADQYVDVRRLNAEDEYLLRSLRYYTSPGRLSYGQEITQELLKDINLYEEFKAQYYMDNRLNSDMTLEELPDKWAKKIAKGLSCF